MRKHLILLCTAAFLSSLHINRSQQNRTNHRIEPMQKPQPPLPMSHCRQAALVLMPEPTPQPLHFPRRKTTPVL
ncbi:hypothetical protein [Prevotella intermedia]|uniref:hypothetical protein n=1 Tax=Prevotella intermedia TaxID=28131 RepID=UPI0012FD69F9|nr:hypothetical protein [Prevotella intermedia]